MWTREQDREYQKKRYYLNIEKIRRQKADLKRKKYHEDIEKGRKESREKYHKNKDKRNIYSNKYAKEHNDDPEFVRQRRVRSLSYYYRNKIKAQARRKVASEVRAGRLIRPKACEHCKLEKRVEAHHEDHSNALEVMWLCKKCHTSHHYKKRMSHPSP